MFKITKNNYKLFLLKAYLLIYFSIHLYVMFSKFFGGEADIYVPPRDQSDKMVGLILPSLLIIIPCITLIQIIRHRSTSVILTLLGIFLITILLVGIMIFNPFMNYMEIRGLFFYSPMLIILVSNLYLKYKKR